MSGDAGPVCAGTGAPVPGRIKPIAAAAFAVLVARGFALPGPIPARPVLAAGRGGRSGRDGLAAGLVPCQPLLAYGGWPRPVSPSSATAVSNVIWLAMCLLAGWCVIVVSQRVGLIYWPPSWSLFAAEWLWIKPDPGWAAWMGGSALTVLCALLIRHQLDLVAQLREAQAGLAEQARTDERNRIARELHDVIGHTLVVSLLHVQSARLAVEHDPADAARALAEAERLGQECLAEIRMTVGMLREDEDPGESPEGVIAPLPGVDALPALVERFRSAGADVSLTVHGDIGGLPATTGLAVYRIAQEALTNAAKHAPGTPTAVQLSVDAGRVTLTADSRAEPGTGQPGTGLGVVSMRERAESLGGTFEAGPGGQGWLVRATLPLDASLRAAP